MATAKLEVTKFNQKSNTIQATVHIDYNYINTTNYFAEVFSPNYKVRDLAAFKIRCHCVCRVDQNVIIIISIKFEKSYEGDLIYAVFLEDSPVPTKMFTCNNTWHEIYYYEAGISFKKYVMLQITVRMDIAPSPTPFAPLHEDTSLTDLELRGHNGSVWVHRAVLAAVSPVFKTELSSLSDGEVKEDHIDMSEFSSATLQLFKDYVYKNDLTIDSDELLSLASFYKMPELELKCIHRIISNLNGDNFFSMLNLALNEKNTKLLLALLECIEQRGLTVDQISKHVNLA